MRNIKLVLLLILGTAVFTNANAQYLEQFIESDNCTSVIVGKKASADGSTMTSHSCDSGTDRTWINLVPHRTHKAGSETPVYFQPKRSRGPEDNDINETGYNKQIKEN